MDDCDLFKQQIKATKIIQYMKGYSSNLQPKKKRKVAFLWSSLPYCVPFLCHSPYKNYSYFHELHLLPLASLVCWGRERHIEKTVRRHTLSPKCFCFDSVCSNRQCGSLCFKHYSFLSLLLLSKQSLFFWNLFLFYISFSFSFQSYLLLLFSIPWSD